MISIACLAPCVSCCRLGGLAAVATSFRSFSSRLRMLASRTMFPTCRTRPPRISSSTSLLEVDRLRSVWRSISAPTCSTTAGSSSTALVTVTSSRLFSSAQSSSKRRRIRKITGIRCFSASSSRKLTSSGSAPSTELADPVPLLGRGEVGAEEEDLQVGGLVDRVGELRRAARGPRRACRCSCADLEQRVGVDAGDLLHRLAPRSSRRRRGREKSTSASASSTRRFWSSSSSDLRVTFSVASTVRSATSLRICSSERRVSVSMSRRAAATSSSRLALPSAVASATRPSRPPCGRGRRCRRPARAPRCSRCAVLARAARRPPRAGASAASMFSLIAFARFSSASRSAGRRA